MSAQTMADPLADMPPAFMGYKLGGKRLIVRVCMKCAGADAVTAWANSHGADASHGYCPEHHQIELAKLIGEEPSR